MFWIYDKNTRTLKIRDLYAYRLKSSADLINIGITTLVEIGHDRWRCGGYWHRDQDKAKQWFKVSCALHPKLDEWCGKTFADIDTAKECIYPVYIPRNDGKQSELIGVLHFIGVTTEELVPDIKEDGARSALLRMVASIISGVLLRDHEKKISVMHERIQKAETVAQSSSELLNKVAEIIRSQIETDSCIIYRLNHDDELQQAAIATSATQNLVIDEASLRHAIMSDSPFKPTATIHGAPVSVYCDSTGKKYCTAMIVLSNEIRSSNISSWDEMLLTSACENVSTILPNLDMRDGMALIVSKMSALLDNMATKEMLSDADTLEIAETIKEILNQSVSDAVSASVSIKNKNYHLFGVDQFYQECDDTVADWNDHHIQLCKKGVYKIKINTPGKEGSDFLYIQLRHACLSNHYKNLLLFLASQIGRVLHGHYVIEWNIQVLQQVRHALRSSLSASIKNFAGAYSLYDNIRKAYISKDLQDEDVVRGLVLSDRFRKLIETAQYYGQTSSILLESSRYLLHTISRETLQLGEHNFNALARDIITSIQVETEARNIDVVYQSFFPLGDERQAYDYNLMRLVIFNLVDNAVKYSFRDKSVIMRAGLRRGGKKWYFEVENVEGVYLPPEHKEFIFETFRRAPGPTGFGYRPGTGLGLPIALRVIRAHDPNALIDYQSAPILRSTSPNAGRTIFWFELPREMSLKEINK